MSFRPIPRFALTHEATLKKPLPGAGYAADSEYEEVVLKGVRIESDAAYRGKTKSIERTKGIRLFYDCTNSRPRGVTFAPGDIISFRDEEYRVKGVAVRQVCGRAHHFEVEMD